MQAATAIVGVDIRCSGRLVRRISYLVGIVIVVSYVREWKNTETESETLGQTESCYNILEVGVLGVDFLPPSL